MCTEEQFSRTLGCASTESSWTGKMKFNVSKANQAFGEKESEMQPMKRWVRCQITRWWRKKCLWFGQEDHGEKRMANWHKHREGGKQLEG